MYLIIVEHGVDMINRIKFAFQGRSPKWAGVRAEYIKANPNCFACSTSEKLEVHHIRPFHTTPELELNADNLVTLCRACHLVIGHLKDFDLENPQVIEWCNMFHTAKEKQLCPIK
jgi:hypothetical protein